MAILYVIGLGGTGSKIAVKFAEIMRDVRRELEEKNLPTYFKVQIFDLAREPFVTEALKRGVLSEDDVGIIPGEIIESRRRLIRWMAESDPEKKEWFPQELVYQLETILVGERGVQRKRPIARIVLHDEEVANQVYQEIAKDLRELADAAVSLGTNTIMVAIVASLGGGFGSGTFLDIAAFVRKAAEAVARGLTVHVFGVFVVPHGYVTLPPPGVRDPLEEENTMAALREYTILTEMCTKWGMAYEEKVGNLGKIIYCGSPEHAGGRLYDALFLVSYRGVTRASNYAEQFEKIDEMIARFLSLMALLPARREEQDRFQRIGAGLAISENIFASTFRALEALPRCSKFMPIVMTFNVATYKFGLDVLDKYFELLAGVDELKKQHEELDRKRLELYAKKRRLEEELAKLKAEYELCINRWSRVARTLSLSDIVDEELRKRVEESVEELKKRIFAAPADYASRARLEAEIEKLSSNLPREQSDILVLVALNELLRSVEREITKIVEELPNLERKREMVESDLARVEQELSRISIIEKMLKTSRYKSLLQMKQTLQQQLEEIDKKIRQARERRSLLERIAGTIHGIAEARKQAIRPEEACRHIKLEVESRSSELRRVDSELDAVKRQADTLEEQIEMYMHELERFKAAHEEVKRIEQLLREEGIRKLMDKWVENRDEFLRMTLTDIIRLVGKEIESTIQQELRRLIQQISNNPSLDFMTSKSLSCIEEFCRSTGLQKNEVTEGTTLIMVNPKDVRLVEKLTAKANIITLDSIADEVRVITVYPAVPFTCTEEFRRFWEEYVIARKHAKSLYAQLHVLPVDKLASKLCSENSNCCKPVYGFEGV